MKIKNLFRILKPPSPSYSYRRKFLFDIVTTAVNDNRRIIDLGNGGRFLHDRVISIDITKNQNVNMICDASNLSFRSNSIDLIISTAVLEHVAEFQSAVAEIERCCAFDGMIYIEVPFLQGFHAHPNDFRRFTLMGLENVFSKFKKIDSGVCVGPFSVFAWYSRKLPRFLLGESVYGLILEFLVGWLTFWIKYLDAIVPGARRVHQLASGVYFYGRKIIT